MTIGIDTLPGLTETRMNDRYRLYGANGSPYSVKVRAAMRYRRLPFDWVLIDDRGAGVLRQVRVPVIPILQHPDGRLENDSTPLLLDLERRHAGRQIVPEDPGLAFLVRLLEDMADEWATKLMFHYRWHDEVDQRYCAQWIARDRLGPAGAEAIDAMARQFRDRQVGRMGLVGVQAENRPVLAECYRRVLALLDAHLADAEYLFGDRPSLADFAWYGQLWDLGIDPTPATIMRQTAPRVHPWLLRIDDLSGRQEGEWPAPDAALSVAARGLLAMAGEVYLPFLLANARAVAQGSERFTVTLLGHPFSQAPFGYQAKCLRQLRELFAALPREARLRVEPVLERAGCLAPLAAGD
jgi:glutathione S-transferase